MLIDKIKELDIGLVLKDEPMKKHTTFRVGGPADIFIKPTDEDSLVKLMKFLNKENVEPFILGQGSNLLVRDEGIRGVVICIHKALTELTLDEDVIYTGSGNTVPDVAKFAQRNSLSNMEQVSGIPGSIGGAVVMNAGAYGGEFKDFVLDVKVLNKDMEVEYISNKDMEFRYRGSSVLDRGYIVLGARLKLVKKDQSEIDILMDDFTNRRVKKQPLNYPSAGSTFKRPEGYYAAALIEEAGLKGLVHKGAMVSKKHAGFIINHDDASYKDVIELIKLVQKEVYDYSGVMLEPEVKIIGENIWDKLEIITPIQFIPMENPQ